MQSSHHNLRPRPVFNDARTIVAPSKESDAPIFKITELELVAGLFQVLPDYANLVSTSLESLQ
jgi:hypothetical protein